MITHKMPASNLHLPKKQKEYEHLFVLLFTRLALQGIVCYTYKSVLSGGKYKWNVLPSKTWNNVLTHIVKYLTSLDVKWNLPTFAKRTFHICKANISPRSDFTCPKGQISLGDLLYSRSPKGSFYFWSEWLDSNQRPLGPEPSALPSCATPG